MMAGRSIPRRVLVKALGLAPLSGNARALARPAVRRDVLSVTAATSLILPENIPEQTSFMLSLPLESGCTMLRVGYANVSPAPYGIQRVCCRQLPDQGDAGGDWSCFAFSGAPGITIPAVTPAAGTLPALPQVTWSDWLAYPTGGGRPLMEFRTLVPPQILPVAKMPGTVPILRPGQGAKPAFLRNGVASGDYVSSPRAPVSWGVAHASPLFVIQYRPRVPGLQIVMGGDSHLAMWDSFVKLAASDLSTPALPIAVWNAAWGGVSSNRFWPALDAALAAANPSIVVIQGWTANDGMTQATDLAYLARVAESAARARQAGAMPVILKPLPRHLNGTRELASWQMIAGRLDQLVPGALVFDPAPYVESPTLPGNWQSGLSGDGVHPDLKGNEALRGPFEQVLRPLLGG